MVIAYHHGVHCTHVLIFSICVSLILNRNTGYDSRYCYPMLFVAQAFLEQRQSKWDETSPHTLWYRHNKQALCIRNDVPVQRWLEADSHHGEDEDIPKEALM